MPGKLESGGRSLLPRRPRKAVWPKVPACSPYPEGRQHDVARACGDEEEEEDYYDDAEDDHDNV